MNRSLTNCSRVTRFSIAACCAIAGLAAASKARAAIYFSETFTYAAGNLTASGNWVAHSGAGSNPIQVNGSGEAVVAQGAGSREDDNRITNQTLAAGQTIYAGFDVKVTASGAIVGDGEYFAHFKDAGTNFVSRVFVTSTTGGDFTFGLRDFSGTVPVKWATPLTFGTTYRVVHSYNFDTGVCELWVDPVDINSTKITASGTAGATTKAVTAYALRQANPTAPAPTETMDNLCVAGIFEEARTCTSGVQTNPTGVGSAAPFSACLNSTPVTLTVVVTPGTNPTSTAHTVTGNLASIGGSASQAFTESPTNTFTFVITPTAGSGVISLPITVQETAPLARTGSTNINLNVVDCSALPTNLKISQFYGAGGNAGSLYDHDYVELFNKGASPISLNGLSIQYAAQNGSFNNAVALPNVNVAPFTYYLIQLATGGGAAPALPTPDFSSTGIDMSGTVGNIALVASTVAIGGDCTAVTVVDKVSFNGGSCGAEGSPMSAISTTTAGFRKDGGCTDTDVNSNDFLVLTPAPRNSSTTGSCAGTSPSGTPQPSIPDPVCTGASTLLSVLVTPGTLPPSTGITVSVNLTPIGGPANQTMYDDGPGGGHGDATAGDGIYSIQSPNVALTTSAGVKNLAVTISDAELRTNATSLTVQVDRCSPTATAIVSPVALCTTGGVTDILVFANPATTGGDAIQTVVANLSSIGLSPTQSLFDDATNGDEIAGDNTWTYRMTVGPQTVGVKNITYAVTDADPRTFNGAVDLNIINCTSAASSVVISQIYGGGGNTGAVYLNDYIELFNRGASPVDISGWSVQYASETGSFSQKTDIPAATTLQPGQYYLVREASGGSNGVVIPVTPDVLGGINMGATGGKIALVNDGTLIAANCTAASVMDLVGYGSSATCFEGAYYAPSSGNARAAHRLQNGCQDNNQNAPDFLRDTANPRNTASPFNVCSIAPTCSCRADTNGDTLVNGKDVQAFAACVIAGVFNQPCACADVNNNGAVNTADISAFVTAALAGACAP